MIACASPKYLKGKRKPVKPGDIQNHAVIGYSYLSTGDEWVFHGPDGEARVKTQPRIRANNGDTCRAAALAHQGIILQPTFIVGMDIQRGDLVELMPEYKSTELGVYAVYPSRKLLSPRIRAMVDFLIQEFKTAQWHT